MLVGDTVVVAFQAIRANTLRSLLTMLGIVIGVGAVITMVALGSGAQKAVEERINALGADLLNIYPGQQVMGGIASQNRVSLTIDDADALKRDGTLMQAVVPEMQSNLQIKYGSQNINTTVLGTTANYTAVRRYDITAGRMFRQGDDESRQRYAVLGASIPNMLNTNPAAMIGQALLIRGIPFEIIGILSEKGGQGWQNPDEQIVIPLSTAQFRVFGSDRLRTIAVQVKPNVSLDAGMVDIERVMRREHKIRPGGDNDFQIRNQREFLATQQATTQILTALLASVAAVSLVVGGIGIMNIMLVSVTERTREIGVRKAVGASKGNILLQFLIEALVLCITGGVIGILAGVGAAVALAKLMHWNTLISPASIIVAFAFSAGVGLFFGIWPARKAASLDPIQALRYE
jgi:putative ABC transport system permease protein